MFLYKSSILMSTKVIFFQPLGADSTELVVSVVVFGPAQKVRYHVESVKLDFAERPCSCPLEVREAHAKLSVSLKTEEDEEEEDSKLIRLLEFWP